MPMAVLPWTGSSPHTRGAQPGRPSPAPIPRIIPAYAGSTDVFPLAGDIVPDHPRIRGEHGSTGRRTAGANGIIPAYAGSTWRGGRRSGRRTDHPRIRGEHGFDRSVGKRYMGSSPHTRGALASDVERAVIAGIIPAYAGSTVYMSILAAAISDHPRIRGEHGIDVLGRKVAGGSSPHTRGAQWAGWGPGSEVGIIPAYAGSTDSRIRIASSRPGSSPHTRGARRPRPTGARGRRIIPAYAGSTPEPRPSAPPPSDHPRIRGEHDIITATGCRPWGSSPHTRGARADAHGDPALDGIIPAYAGSTPAGLFWRRRDRDHPRIRGEHLPDADGCAALDGSSPHTRGALQLGADQSRHLGIIPAYAGSTSCGRR